MHRDICTTSGVLTNYNSCDPQSRDNITVRPWSPWFLVFNSSRTSTRYDAKLRKRPNHEYSCGYAPFLRLRSLLVSLLARVCRCDPVTNKQSRVCMQHTKSSWSTACEVSVKCSWTFWLGVCASIRLGTRVGSSSRMCVSRVKCSVSGNQRSCSRIHVARTTARVREHCRFTCILDT